MMFRQINNMNNNKAFRNFFGQHLLAIRKDNNIKPQERVKHIEKLWQNLDESEKIKYTDKQHTRIIIDC